MKRLTASEVRKNWFRVLDEVAAGEGVVLERKGQWLVLRREDKKVTQNRNNSFLTTHVSCVFLMLIRLIGGVGKYASPRARLLVRKPEHRIG